MRVPFDDSSERFTLKGLHGTKKRTNATGVRNRFESISPCIYCPGNRPMNYGSEMIRLPYLYFVEYAVGALKCETVSAEICFDPVVLMKLAPIFYMNFSRSCFRGNRWDI